MGKGLIPGEELTTAFFPYGKLLDIRFASGVTSECCARLIALDILVMP
jgi:hypothetical protein